MSNNFALTCFWGNVNGQRLNSLSVFRRQKQDAEPGLALYPEKARG
jgi:hypothetical protein